MSAETRQAIRVFLVENFMFRGAIDQMTDDASLIQAGILDSVGVLSLVTFLEETFEITVTDDEVEPENLDSIDAVTAFVTKKKA